MPTFPLHRRPAREPDEPLLDMILGGQSLPPDAPLDAHALARRLADLAGPAEPGVLPGEAAARSAFARTALPAVRRPGRSPRLRVALCAVLVAVTAGLGGAVAAYADVLPGPVQNFAHHVIGAPPPAHARPHPGTVNPSRTRTAEPTAAKSPKPSAAPKPPKPSIPPKPPKPSIPPKPTASADLNSKAPKP